MGIQVFVSIYLAIVFMSLPLIGFMMISAKNLHWGWLIVYSLIWPFFWGYLFWSDRKEA